MADPSRYTNTDDTGVDPDHASATGIPRWVKVTGIVVAVLAMVVVAIMLISGGEHGPSRHTSSGDSRDGTPATIVMADSAPLRGGQ